MLSTLPLLASFLLPASQSQEPQPEPSRGDLEAWFAEHLNDCELVGRFTLDTAPADAPAQDRYRIRSAEKLQGNLWRITAEIEYGQGVFPINVDADVLWAGDTPVISITNKVFPLVGTYSARVLFDHDGRYAGTWSGTGYGGHMFGRVENESSTETPSEPADEGEAPKTGVHWPSFRGPRASGVCEGFASPTEWDVESGRNIRWRTKIAGLAHSSPVIWGDRIYLTSAVGEKEAELTVGLYGAIDPVPDEGEQHLNVLCIDKNDGSVIWERTAIVAVPKIKRHTKGSHAASSPATDGEHVVAFFGSEGLYCYDRDGELLWQKDLGVLDSGYYVVPSAQWGMASSPVIHDGLVVLQCDVQGQSFLAAYRVEDGREVWRSERDEVPTWSTPTIVEHAGLTQVVVNGYRHIGGYELDSGAEIWIVEGGGGDIPVPTPVVAGDLVFIMNAHGRMAPILAMDLAAEGIMSLNPPDEEFITWFHPRRGNYMQTPIVYGEELYGCSDGGILRCYDVATGEEYYSERLSSGGSGFTSSGIAADGKLYFASEEGEVYVVAAGMDFDVLAVNDLGEECMASPAASEGTLFYRTRRHLTAIE